jgi:hypothetical protein
MTAGRILHGLFGARVAAERTVVVDDVVAAVSALPNENREARRGVSK